MGLGASLHLHSCLGREVRLGEEERPAQGLAGVTLGAAFSATLGLASARSFSSLLTVPPPVGHEL